MPNYSRVPWFRLLTLWVVCATLAGCQAIARIPSPTDQLPSSTSPSIAAESPSATESAASSAETAPSQSSAPSIDVTAAPSESAAATPSPAGGGIATIESLDANLLPQRDPVELAYQYGRTSSTERVARSQPFDVRVGDKQSFTISSVTGGTNYEVSATLVLSLDHVLVYVADDVQVDQQALERDARRFNDQIYARNRELFGSEWTPGIDGDPRLTILNGNIEGAGGYFSSSDEVPKSVNRFSNEREMFYINVLAYPPGTPDYLRTLAHEFQHMIAYNEAERPEVWFNEGFSQLAEELNGFTQASVNVAPAYLIDPDLQLTDWGDDPQTSTPHYGASYLFMSYFYQHYGDNLRLNDLMRGGAGERLELFADAARRIDPQVADFGDLYADWSVANTLNDPRIDGGRFAYTNLAATVTPTTLPNNLQETVAQFGTDFWQIDPAAASRTLRFDGSDTIGLVNAQPDGTGMWWSNRGDNANGTLTRTFDLRNLSSATMQFRLWYDLESGWDYGFVSVSTDGGQTFKTLQGRHTTRDDPQGLNWGDGYTGLSGGANQAQWLDEQIDLTPYVGQQITLRFSMITDDGNTHPGMVIDNIRIPELNFSDDAESDAAGWDARGFARIDNRLPQRWEVRLIRFDGGQATVEALPLDANNQATAQIGPNERTTLVVMATTPHTTERASYAVTTGQP